MIKLKQVSYAKNGGYKISQEDIEDIVDLIKSGKKVQFESRVDYNIMDEYLANKKIPYWVDDIGQCLWV